MSLPYITIFTSTYNRMKLLERLYHSLCNQKSFNFEWLIVDDESDDETEQMVQQWMQKEGKKFEIRFLKQLHGGKHRALNKGFEIAKGYWFFIVDSDDELTEDATEIIEKWGREVENRYDIVGISGMKITVNGVIGGVPNVNDNNWIEASNFERSKYGLNGDKAEVYKTKILKNFPFPEFDGEFFVTEAVCWDAIAAAGYKLRWYNYPIYKCEYLADGLTNSGANSLVGHKNNYRGYCYYIRQCMDKKNRLESITDFRDFDKTGRKIDKTIKERAKDINYSIFKYIFYLLFFMPILYFIRLLRKIWRKSGF